MCGIFGWLPTRPLPGAQARAIGLMLTQALQHRGPDDTGHVIFPVITGSPSCTEKQNPPEQFRLLLGQTRLSIIDLSQAGHQPMSSPDGRFTIVYNGEVYNYRELRAELRNAGLNFYTETDTEVVLAALTHWGEGALARFTGMFALALFDAAANSLLLARDFFGIKPLYYHVGDGLRFASELPALLQVPGAPRQADPHAVYQFLCYAQYDSGGRTFVRDIRHLPAGHFLKYDLEQPEVPPEPQCYWKPDLTRRSTLSFSDAATQLREMFFNSVRLHLRSDVPLGVALSGGIDSSATTCVMRRLEPDMELHTFSFIAKNSTVSEESWADLVADHVGAIRHKIEVEPVELVRDLDAMLRALGEPFGSTSIYAQYRVFQLAKECGITVTLDGQGADELLAGYQGYPGQRLSSLLRHGHWAKAWSFASASRLWPGRSWPYLITQTAREFVPPWLTPLALQCIGRSAAPPWLDTAALRDQGLQLLREDHRDRLFPCPDKLRQTLAYQLTYNGLPQLLRHGDRNAMAHSIESRVPFLTRELAEFCLSLPEEYLVDMGGCSKSIFRQAMCGVVPDEILLRRDKVGFATPEKEWLLCLAPWVQKTLAGARNIPYLHVGEAHKEWQRIVQNPVTFDWRVWRWLCYIRWAQIYNIEK